jgi:hypothetical protein
MRLDALKLNTSQPPELPISAMAYTSNYTQYFSRRDRDKFFLSRHLYFICLLIKRFNEEDFRLNPRIVVDHIVNRKIFFLF